MNSLNRIFSIWIGPEVAIENRAVIEENLRSTSNFLFKQYSREDFPNIANSFSRNQPDVMFSDIARVSLLTPESLYLDCDFKILNHKFEEVLFGNDLVLESPFVFANGFLHLESELLRIDLIKYLLENSAKSMSSPHIATGPYALTRFACRQVWERKYVFNIVDKSVVTVLPTFIHPAILRFLKVKYAVSHSSRSSWAGLESEELRFGILRSFMWYLMNQTSINSLLLLVLRFAGSSSKPKKTPEFEGITGIILKALVEITSRATKGNFVDLTTRAERIDEVQLQKFMNGDLWLLTGDSGLFGCVLTNQQVFAEQILAEGLSEVCILLDEAQDVWHNGDSKVIWYSLTTRHSRIRICIRKNLHKDKIIGSRE